MKPKSKIKLFDRIVRFVDWCDTHGVLPILVDFILKVVYWYIVNN